MGDWNTLHFFSDKHFYEKVVPDLTGKGNLLKKYFDSKLGNYLLFHNSDNDKRITSVLEYCQFFDEDFKTHKLLYEIETRKKKPDEEYQTFMQKMLKDTDEFYKQNGTAADDLATVLTLIMFSECAAFNPHLILGRRIFSGNVGAKPKSVAEAIISQIDNSPCGSTHSYGSGIMNWITNEDLKLLWLDRSNLVPTNSKEYFNDFLKFIEIAIENDFGVVSGTNMRESILKLAENPNINIEVDLEKLGLQSVIIYDGN